MNREHIVEQGFIEVIKSAMRLEMTTEEVSNIALNILFNACYKHSKNDFEKALDEMHIIVHNYASAARAIGISNIINISLNKN